MLPSLSGLGLDSKDWFRFLFRAYSCQVILQNSDAAVIALFLDKLEYSLTGGRWSSKLFEQFGYIFFVRIQP